MLYTLDKFTLPSGGNNLSQQEWEIRVGIRCSECGEKFIAPGECACPKNSQSNQTSKKQVTETFSS